LTFAVAPDVATDASQTLPSLAVDGSVNVICQPLTAAEPVFVIV
jgi:hypothetical protein